MDNRQTKSFGELLHSICTFSLQVDCTFHHRWNSLHLHLLSKLRYNYALLFCCCCCTWHWCWSFQRHLFWRSIWTSSSLCDDTCSFLGKFFYRPLMAGIWMFCRSNYESTWVWICYDICLEWQLHPAYSAWFWVSPKSWSDSQCFAPPSESLCSFSNSRRRNFWQYSQYICVFLALLGDQYLSPQSPGPFFILIVFCCENFDGISNFSW